MDIKMPVRILKASGTVFLLALSLFVFLPQSTLAVVQNEEMPPFPILYGGRALMDGQPLPDGTRIEATIDDYVAWAFVIENGIYINLLVGPPNREYFYKKITFHTLGVTAAEQDEFLPAGGPVFKDTNFHLNFPLSPTLITVQAPSDEMSDNTPTAVPSNVSVEPTLTTTFTTEPTQISLPEDEGQDNRGYQVSPLRLIFGSVTIVMMYL